MRGYTTGKVDQQAHLPQKLNFNKVGWDYATTAAFVGVACVPHGLKMVGIM